MRLLTIEALDITTTLTLANLASITFSRNAEDQKASKETQK